MGRLSRDSSIGTRITGGTRIAGLGIIAVLALAGAAGAEETPAPATTPPAGKSQTVVTGGILARYGAHEGYDRLVLDWPQPVKVTVGVAHGVATLSFSQRARLNVVRLNEILPEGMRPARLRPDGMALTFRVPAGQHIKDHSRGKLVVIDIVGPPGESPPKLPAENALPSSGPIEEPQPDVAAAQPAPAVAPEARAAPPSAAPAPGPVGTPFTPDLSDGGSPSDPTLLADTADHQVRVSSTPIDDGFSLRFDWNTAVKAAVFKLSGMVWIVFDHPDRISVNPLAGADGVKPPALSQVDNPSATVLRVPAPPDAVVIVGRPGNTWLVDVRRPNPKDASADLQPGRVLAEQDGFYKTKGPARPVTVVDTLSGEVLIAIPLRTAGAHFDSNIDHKIYHVLPTSQGMLFRPESDTVRIGIEKDGVRVTNPLPTISLQP